MTRFRYLTLSKPLAVIDLESTGTDPVTDRIVEIAVLTIRPDGTEESFETRVNPRCPIPSSATAVHGITDADVREAPTFAELAPNLVTRLADNDLAGFGIAGFDLPLLCAECVRTGVPFALAGRSVLDALAVFRRYEARTLSAAVAFYLGRSHTGAHAAATDARAAAEVLDAQVGRYGLSAAPTALHRELVEVDLAGKFRRDERGAVVFAFGKHSGRVLVDVARTDPDYLAWVLTRPFLADVHELVRAALAGSQLFAK
ncbi:MAG: 3'-5' exonuclease [Planctomycetes bacterium]|nr:3'-5' exonuclease [Planctomycetota bacterium]